MPRLRYTFLLLVWMLAAQFSRAQNYAKALHVQDVAAYHKDILKNPQHKLVEISKAIPGIALDIRYATTNNFMHRKMYPQGRAFARLPVVKALQKVEAQLKPMSLGLKIFDAYRPYSITVDFFNVVHDTRYVADPKVGSKHNRGCAIDITLINLKTGKEITMPTDFDSFNARAGANYANPSAEIIQHRELLKSIMQHNGFQVNPDEWWHYDFNGWPSYPLLDVPFSQL